MKLPISLVIISQDQDHHLQDCINSAPFVSEVVVITTDLNSTSPLVLPLEAQVYPCSLRGSGEQKKWGVTQAKNDWVLCLEPQERVSEDLAQEITERFQHLKEKTLYRLPRVAFYMNSWVWHGGYFPDFQGRLFNRRFYQWNTHPILPQVEGGGYFEYFTGPLEHFIFKNFHEQVLTSHRRALSLASQEAERSLFYYQLTMVTGPVWYFVKHYILKQGFRDGWPGLILAVHSAHALFMQAVYQYELKSTQRLL